MGADPARIAYDAFAPIYNEFNHQNDYEMWVGKPSCPSSRSMG